MDMAIPLSTWLCRLCGGRFTLLTNPHESSTPSAMLSAGHYEMLRATVEQQHQCRAAFRRIDVVYFENRAFDIAVIDLHSETPGDVAFAWFEQGKTWIVGGGNGIRTAVGAFQSTRSLNREPAR